MLDGLGLEAAFRWYTGRQAILGGVRAEVRADPLGAAPGSHDRDRMFPGGAGSPDQRGSSGATWTLGPSVPGASKVSPSGGQTLRDIIVPHAPSSHSSRTKHTSLVGQQCAAAVGDLGAGSQRPFDRYDKLLHLLQPEQGNYV